MLIEILDEIMDELGEQLDNTTFLLEGKKYRLFKTDIREAKSYYIELA